MAWVLSSNFDVFVVDRDDRTCGLDVNFSIEYTELVIVSPFNSNLGN